MAVHLQSNFLIPITNAGLATTKAAVCILPIHALTFPLFYVDKLPAPRSSIFFDILRRNHSKASVVLADRNMFRILRRQFLVLGCGDFFWRFGTFDVFTVAFGLGVGTSVS